MAKICRIDEETPDTKTFALELNGFTSRPGQFVEASVFGVGEAPFGVSTVPTTKGSFEITVRAVGSVTNALHQLRVGDNIGIKGPLGNSFLDKIDPRGQDILFIGGGIGLPPLRSLIHYVFTHRQEYKRVIILYGARTPQDRVYKKELAQWAKKEEIEFLETVDVGDETWQGNVGVVTTLFSKIKVDPKKTIAYTCGPPIMIKFVILDLLKMGFAEERIVSTLERYMKCGVGKCGHCCIGHKYVCTDGPVFDYKEIKGLPEKAI